MPRRQAAALVVATCLLSALSFAAAATVQMREHKIATNNVYPLPRPPLLALTDILMLTFWVCDIHAPPLEWTRALHVSRVAALLPASFQFRHSVWYYGRQYSRVSHTLNPAP